MANIYNMPDDDYNRYLNNKKSWETGSGTDTARAAFENSQLRDKYNITGDNYSYEGLSRANVYGNTQYTTDRDKSIAALGNYSRYTDPYSTGDIRRKLENFNYNPEQDKDFQVYKDMYARQGQAAQGQTLANLTAISGGRNNSWASAATAQVGQAYAQKTADMIPQLAQQAYNKLLQRYNIAAQESDRAYGRWTDAYGRTREMADLYNTLGQQELQNRRQQAMDDVYFRDSDEAYGMTAYENALKRRYLPDEYARGAEKSELELGMLREDAAAYPEKIQLGLEMDRISYNTALQWYNQLPDEIKDTQEGRKLALALQKKALAAPTSGGSGGGGGGVAGMSKTALKEYVNYNYKDENGELNKYQLLKDLAFNGYSDEEANAVINAAGITQAEINAWQKTYAETVNNYMFPPKQYTGVNFINRQIDTNALPELEDILNK